MLLCSLFAVWCGVRGRGGVHKRGEGGRSSLSVAQFYRGALVEEGDELKSKHILQQYPVQQKSKVINTILLGFLFRSVLITIENSLMTGMALMAAALDATSGLSVESGLAAAFMES